MTQYEVRYCTGDRFAGPFAVLDTACNAACTGSKVSGVASLQLHVAEIGSYDASRVRAFASEGRLTWAVPCNGCAVAVQRARTPREAPYCYACDSLRAVPDRG